MKRNYIKGFSNFTKINEQGEKPFRLYGEGETPQAELIRMLKNLVDDINKANPMDQESYNMIKDDIRSKTTAIKNHRSFGDLKEGIPWQDIIISLDDWSAELKNAVYSLTKKAAKKGLV